MATSGLLRGWTAASVGQEGRALAPPTTARLELDPARAARWLALVTAAVVGACLLVMSLSIVLGSPSMYGLVPIFDLGREASVPAGYSALLLLAAALLLALVATIERSRKDGLWLYWAVLAVGFAYLAADELAAIHEKLNRPLRGLLGASPDTTTWVIAGALGALAAGAFFLPFLRALPAGRAARFVLAGAVYVGSAVGLETVWLAMWLADGPAGDWVRLGQVALEEGGEMAGVALFVWALLDHLRAAGARLELRF